jgi:hypothetical protein
MWWNIISFTHEIVPDFFDDVIERLIRTPNANQSHESGCTLTIAEAHTCGIPLDQIIYKMIASIKH